MVPHLVSSKALQNKDKDILFFPICLWGNEGYQLPVGEGWGKGWGVGFVGCRVKEEGVEVSHLLFIDNTLVFCEASHSHMVNLSWLFIWFEAILGLKINLQKSEVIFIGKVANVEDLATKLGC